MADLQPQTRMIRANDLEFGILEVGPAQGPLALCLHGFPDSANTWRHLLPALADAGYHGVAPFMRGYAPTGLPADGAYNVGALAADAIALHEALSGDGDAVLIGHDWGAEAAYPAAAHAPERWRRLVTLSVPPASLDPVLFSDYEQLKRFFYVYMFRDPTRFADAIVAAGEMAFLDQLWRDWSPGYDAKQDLANVKECVREPSRLAAAIEYYRQNGAGGNGGGEQGAGECGSAGRYAEEQQAAERQAPQPTLYLHGADDGCISADLARRAESLLAPSSRIVVVEEAGHFLHLEKPVEIGEHILGWIA
ncbi:MAG: alpha/beta hydrolase [Nocardiopsaceae bacterium]|jgi:pimeloyl-ACP methyl ester carboxylesterase|nr:alpha/beta hydrolase [Nocardiopsaceae bacterium]